MDKKRKISQIGFAQSKQLWKSKSLALALIPIPTENHISMACLDAHLYEIEYTQKEQLNSRESSHLNKLMKAHKVRCDQLKNKSSRRVTYGNPCYSIGSKANSINFLNDRPVLHKLILINYFIIDTYKVREKKCGQ
jgi:hypothetical protein